MASAPSRGMPGSKCWKRLTQWDDLPQYDNESNKWHDSMLVAQKPVPDELR